MANDGQIVFEVTADGKHAIADIKEITRAIQTESKNWDKAAAESTDNISSHFSGMLKKLVAGFSAVKIGKALLDIGKDAIQAASDLQEVQNVVDVTFGDGATKIESWSKAAGAQFGLTETQAKKFASTMGAMMKSSGLAGEQIVDMSTDLAGLAADMASFYNLDFDEAFAKIRSGISGETEPLKQLGINMSVANLNAYALQQGLSKTFDQMTQGEQTMLRYQYMMSATADAQGDFSRTSDGYANSLRTLETNVANIKTALGESFIGVVTEATGWLNSFIQTLMPDESKKTVLDDFKSIDIKASEKLEQIRQVADEARLLTDELDRIGGSKTDKAGSKIQKLADDLSGIDFDQGKAGIVKEFISTLANDIPALAEVQGTSNEQAVEWLNGIATAANSLDEGDAAAWSALLDEIRKGLPELENTDAGSKFLTALGGGVSDVLAQYGVKSSEATEYLEKLGYSTDEITEKQNDWLETCKRLVKTIPGLSSIINTETGEVKGGTQAVYDYIKAWEDGQTKLVMMQALEQKESALASRFADLPGLRLDKAVAEKRVRDYRDKLQALYDQYGATLTFDAEGYVTDESLRAIPDEAFDEAEKMVNAYDDLVEKAAEATEKYQLQADALEEAEIALEEAKQTVEEMPGTAEKVVDASAQWLEKTGKTTEQIEQIVANAEEALKNLADYAESVRENVRSNVESTVSGFERVTSPVQKLQAQISALKDAYDAGTISEEEYTNKTYELNQQMNEQGLTAKGMIDNLKSQAAFMDEYLKYLEQARANGVSADVLAELSDGSVESVDRLKALSNATDEEISDINEYYSNIQTQKEQLTEALTQQKLKADDVYLSMAEAAKKAVAELDLGQEAADNSGKTIQGLAKGISDNVDSVKSSVDSIINQLNRLNGWGIDIDFGGFGNIHFTTSAGKTEGSARMGWDYIPRDDFIMRLHEGEGVLTAEENRIWHNIKAGGISTDDIEALSGAMGASVQAGGNVYLDGRIVGQVISDQQGRSYRTLARSGWQGGK